MKLKLQLIMFTIITFMPPFMAGGFFYHAFVDLRHVGINTIFLLIRCVLSFIVGIIAIYFTLKTMIEDVK